MVDNKDKCFLYHKDDTVEIIDSKFFCRRVTNQKLNILKRMVNKEENYISHNGVIYLIEDFWFTDIALPVGYKTEFHIKLNEKQEKA